MENTCCYSPDPIKKGMQFITLGGVIVGDDTYWQCKNCRTIYNDSHNIPQLLVQAEQRRINQKLTDQAEAISMPLFDIE